MAAWEPPRSQRCNNPQPHWAPAPPESEQRPAADTTQAKHRTVIRMHQIGANIILSKSPSADGPWVCGTVPVSASELSDQAYAQQPHLLLEAAARIVGRAPFRGWTSCSEHLVLSQFRRAYGGPVTARPWTTGDSRTSGRTTGTQVSAGATAPMGCACRPTRNLNFFSRLRVGNGLLLSL